MRITMNQAGEFLLYNGISGLTIWAMNIAQIDWVQVSSVIVGLSVAVLNGAKAYKVIKEAKTKKDEKDI